MNKKSKTYMDKVDDIKLIGEAAIVGLFAGLIIITYRFLLHGVEDILPKIRLLLFNHLSIIPIFILSVLILAIVSGMIRNWEKFSGGSGIPQVEAEIKGYIRQNTIKIIIAKITCGLTCALGGLSLGREGPSIQIGAMTGKLFARIIKRNKTTEKFLLSCGASAGLSAAFNAPVSGVIFAIEEVHKHISKKLLITTITATVIADYTSKLFYGPDTVFNLDTLHKHIPFEKYWWILVLAILLSLIGYIYTTLMKIFIKFYDKTNMPIQVRPLIPFSVGLILFFTLPEVTGGGNHLLKFIVNNKVSIGILILMFVIKMIFSLLSFTSGVAGGIFFPILVMGATVGAVFGNIISPDYTDLFVLLSMAGLLTSIVRAPLTAIILIFEMTGSLSYLLPLSIVCLVAYVVTNYVGLEPIYEYLLENLLEKNGIEKPVGGEKILINTVVQPGSIVEDKKICEINWPEYCLIISIVRGNEEITPRGNILLRSGDELGIILNEFSYADDYKILNQLCLTEKELIDDI